MSVQRRPPSAERAEEIRRSRAPVSAISGPSLSLLVRLPMRGHRRFPPGRPVAGRWWYAVDRANGRAGRQPIDGLPTATRAEQSLRCRGDQTALSGVRREYGGLWMTCAEHLYQSNGVGRVATADLDTASQYDLFHVSFTDLCQCPVGFFQPTLYGRHLGHALQLLGPGSRSERVIKGRQQLVQGRLPVVYVFHRIQG